MSLSYNLLLATDRSPEDVLEAAAETGTYDRVGGALRGEGVTVFASAPSAFSRSVALEDVGLDASVSVVFELHRDARDAGERAALEAAYALALEADGAFL